MGYRTIETQLSPPGFVKGIDDFKRMVEDEVDIIIEARNEAVKKNNLEDEDISLPICVYILFQDYSVQKAFLFPQSDKEKKAMIMSFKEQVVNPDPSLITSTAIYGAFVSEVFMSKAAKDPVTGKVGKLGEKITRVLFHFENRNPNTFECKLYSIIDPYILSYQEEESNDLTKAMNSLESEARGVMTSLFDWSLDQQMDILGKSSRQHTETFNLKAAIEYVQKILKENKTSNS